MIATAWWVVRYENGQGGWLLLFVKSHRALLDFKSRVICDRLDNCSQLISYSFNGIKHSVFAMCLCRALRRTSWPVICFECFEVMVCLFRVEGLRALHFVLTPERLPFAMTTSTTERVEWLIPPPEHTHSSRTCKCDLIWKWGSLKM